MAACCWLQGTKVFGKKELRHVPFIGWIWYFTESIFLQRNWALDEQIISEGVSRIVTYPEDYWITVRDQLCNFTSVNFLGAYGELCNFTSCCHDLIQTMVCLIFDVAAKLALSMGDDKI
jgi:hypothetical protein